MFNRRREAVNAHDGAHDHDHWRSFSRNHRQPGTHRQRGIAFPPERLDPCPTDFQSIYLNLVNDNGVGHQRGRLVPFDAERVLVCRYHSGKLNGFVHLAGQAVEAEVDDTNLLPPRGGSPTRAPQACTGGRTSSRFGVRRSERCSSSRVPTSRTRSVEGWRPQPGSATSTS